MSEVNAIFDADAFDEASARYDASNREHVKRRERLSKIIENKQGAVVKGIMSSTEGRAWMWWFVFQVCHVNESSFSTNGLTMAEREGERNAGQQLHSQLLALCPDEYVMMLKEIAEIIYA